MVVFRPADAEETLFAWKAAVEEQRPVALILSRQNIKNLPTISGNRRTEAQQLTNGGYIVSDCEGDPDIIMLASGSEVATLVEGKELLENEGIATRIVSVPSEGLFQDQPADYKANILPAGVKRFGLTSGLPVTLQGLVGDNGRIHGMSSFGYSAPYNVLDQELGFTGENVFNIVKSMIKES